MVLFDFNFFIVLLSPINLEILQDHQTMQFFSKIYFYKFISDIIKNVEV